MSFWSYCKAVADIKMAPNAPKPPRTKTPLKLSQTSAVSFGLPPFILAEEAGAIFKSNLPSDDTICMVGTLSLFGVDMYRAYLSKTNGAYIQLAVLNNRVEELRLYRPYDEYILAPQDRPPSGEEASPDYRAFWLAEADGYIGLPVMQSRNDDGPVSYQRSWGTGSQRIPPFQVTERTVDASGAAHTIRYQMMHYSRQLKDKLYEHLLAAVVNGATVDLWLGIDLDESDIKVFASADAP